MEMDIDKMFVMDGLLFTKVDEQTAVTMCNLANPAEYTMESFYCLR